MPLLLLAFVFLACVLGVILFTVKDGEAPRHNPKPLSLEPVFKEPQQAVVPEEGQIDKLSAKLKKLKEDYQKLEEELASTKKSEALSLAELEKIKSWMEKEKTQEEAVKKELAELKEKLVKKDQEYEKEFSSNLILKKDALEYKQKYEIADTLNRENSERLRILEAQNAAYKQESKAQAQLVAELKKKNDHTEWVSKKEYDELKERIKRQEAPGEEETGTETKDARSPEPS
ncbi:MAG: hypothetical protein A2Y00_00805 [Omnitrophica WOR_2 bacterium GWF2_43_52]|nr:MAG: hypothetical protein A2062_07300 [Omnitrophica WOR_2 bacterium GWA2_44_7]OGX21001.1 MAG: hypothetical protein A2Y00_00805 [Omnitrophica WOR_2 bacterium GWF2_43_52]HAH21180.1 hypothetical protein [Candidatus Omnitrophota bacterium]HBG63218.1 hypothetical protein [Candidatus Omnitrophota bacterium]